MFEKTFRRLSLMAILAVGAPALAHKTPSRTPWETNPGKEGIVSFGFTSSRFGAIEEYAFAYIPRANDRDWSAAPDPVSIRYEITSTLCDVQECLTGADFTYFQTSVRIPSRFDLDSVRLELSGIDDGVRVTVFNSDHPDGVTVPNGFVFLGESASVDLLPFVMAGQNNRIVLTHTDDCCSEAILFSARIFVNGSELLPRSSKSGFDAAAE